MSTASRRLFILLQRALPKHLLTAIIYRLARVSTVAIKNFLISRFVRFYGVDVDEVDKPIPDGFDTFNAFFTRELAAGVRPVDGSPDTIVSPVDGTVSAAGRIENDQVFQAKGLRYSLSDLLAADLQDADRFRDGLFATIYLAPYNYHRVHAPMDGSLRLARYVPGALFSVNATTVESIPELFERNERLICHFESAETPYVLIFVGALNVGSITTPWTGEIRPEKHGIVQDYDIATAGTDSEVSKGDLLGWFNMGSTVIVLLPANSHSWSERLSQGATVEMGQVIGRLSNASEG